MEILLLLTVSGLANGALYGLIALGLVLIYKTQDVVQFAHGEVLMIGAFVGYTAYSVAELPYPISLVAAIVVCGLMGYGLERVAFRPIAHHHHITLAMVTVGLSFALKGLARIPYGRDIYTFPRLFPEIPTVKLGMLIVTPQNLATIAIALVLTLALYLFFRSTSIGKQMRATQQNLAGADIIGINTGLIFSGTWALACALGAVAGVLGGPDSLLYPDMGGRFLLKAFAAAVLGGFESVPGAILGGLLIGVIDNLAGFYINTAFQEVSAYCIIILVLFIWPYGLLGRRPTHRV
ncbi:MAG: branched-chain amino acid ABC transporter permease [Alphaproteobacteria bacterium]|nr:branched-chain amino acid ABC transporter permease [Alphaproteobacteria bacterium]